MKRWLFLLYYPLPVLLYIEIIATTVALRQIRVRWPIVIGIDSLWIAVPVTTIYLVMLHARRKFERTRKAQRKNSN